MATDSLSFNLNVHNDQALIVPFHYFNLFSGYNYVILTVEFFFMFCQIGLVRKR